MRATNKETPLISAGARSHQQLFLKNEADVQALDINGNGALHWASGINTAFTIKHSVSFSLTSLSLILSTSSCKPFNRLSCLSKHPNAFVPLYMLLRSRTHSNLLSLSCSPEDYPSLSIWYANLTSPAQLANACSFSISINPVQFDTLLLYKICSFTGLQLKFSA